MKTRQDLRFQALRLIHYVIYRVICDNKDLQTFTGSVTELAEAFHIQRSNIYRDIDSLSAQLHSTGMILGHKDPRKSWRTVTWLSRSYYNGRGTILIKLSYSMVSYVKGIRHMFSDDFHKTILKFNSIHAIRIYEIISADRFFHKDADPEYEMSDLRYWLDCEKKYLIMMEKERLRCSYPKMLNRIFLDCENAIRSTGCAISWISILFTRSVLMRC